MDERKNIDEKIKAIVDKLEAQVTLEAERLAKEHSDIDYEKLFDELKSNIELQFNKEIVTKDEGVVQSEITIKEENEHLALLNLQEYEKKQGAKKASITMFVILVCIVLVAFISLTYAKPYLKYIEATKLMKAGQYEVAKEKFISLDTYLKSEEYSKECQYYEAMALIDEKKYGEAIDKLAELGDYAKALDSIKKYSKNANLLISIGEKHTVALKSANSVVACGDNTYGQCDVEFWKDIVAVSAGDFHTVGLKSDGTLIACGDNSFGQCNVDGWKDIVKISAGSGFTVGLKSDGSVISVGDNRYGQCDVGKLKNVIDISSGGYHLLCLLSNGTVEGRGLNEYGQISVEKWSDIESISAGYYYSLGLKSNGDVVATGLNDSKQCDIDKWEHIRVISAGYDFSTGIDDDGNVVVNDKVDYDINVNNVIAVDTNFNNIALLKTDGTVMVLGNNDFGQCNVSEWRDIMLTSKQVK